MQFFNLMYRVIRVFFRPCHWVDLLVMIISLGLLLRGRVIGVAFTGVVWAVKWAILPKLSIATQLKSKLRYRSPVSLGVILGVVPVSTGAAFFALNQLPIIGDLSMHNYNALGLMLVCFAGYGYLISQEIDRPQQVLLPLIVIGIYALLSLGVMIDKEYLIIATLLSLACISIWQWWFDYSTPFFEFEHRSTTTVAAPIVFLLGQVAVQDRLGVLFSNGLLIQHYYAIPGLFMGFFSGIYVGKFHLNRSASIALLVTPILISVVFGGESGLAFWIAFTFSTFVSSLFYPDRRDLMIGLSLLVTIVMFVGIAQLQSISMVLDSNFRSLLGVLCIGFWMVAALFGNAIRNEPLLESHRRVIKNRLSKRD